MAFAVDSAPAEEVCPICRRRYKKGSLINKEAYRAEYGAICRECFTKGYLDVRTGRTAGIIDNSANIPVRLRPAQILEKPIVFKRKKRPAHGYEYRMPQESGSRLIRDVLLWVIICLAGRIAAGQSNDNIDICAIMLDITVFGGSCVWAAKYFWLLIKGVFCGMGHPRRILLILALGVMVILAIVFEPFSAFAALLRYNL